MTIYMLTRNRILNKETKGKDYCLVFLVEDVVNHLNTSNDPPYSRNSRYRMRKYICNLYRLQQKALGIITTLS